jgi:hypothetical protein
MMCTADVGNAGLQVLTIIAMEKPVTTSADDIRDEKVKVMKSIPPIKLEGVCALLLQCCDYASDVCHLPAIGLPPRAHIQCLIVRRRVRPRAVRCKSYSGEQRLGEWLSPGPNCPRRSYPAEFSLPPLSSPLVWGLGRVQFAVLICLDVCDGTIADIEDSDLLHGGASYQ